MLDRCLAWNTEVAAWAGRLTGNRNGGGDGDSDAELGHGFTRIAADREQCLCRDEFNSPTWRSQNQKGGTAALTSLCPPILSRKSSRRERLRMPHHAKRENRPETVISRSVSRTSIMHVIWHLLPYPSCARRGSHCAGGLPDTERSKTCLPCPAQAGAAPTCLR